jgi:hypothetical protein
MSSNKTSAFVIHYSPLVDRKIYLERNLSSNFELNWVTEKDIDLKKYNYTLESSVFGVSRKLIGLDQGINSRSLVSSRRKAKIEGYVYFLLSFVRHISLKYPNLTTGSLNKVVKLKNSALEVQAMHFHALELGIKSGQNWILVLEDDAVLNTDVKNAQTIIEQIKIDYKPRKIWIDLNLGAGLTRTKTDKKIDRNNLFRVRPPTTRCAVAYLISRDLAIEIISLLQQYGVPQWLYIDNLYQVATRRLKARSYWQTPEIFIQGSEIGNYSSNFEDIRKNG